MTRAVSLDLSSVSLPQATCRRLATLARSAMLCAAFVVAAAPTLADDPAVVPSEYDSAAGRLIRQNLDGERIVDFILVGDSNASYPFGYGMTNGLVTALLERGATQYATTLYSMHNGNTGSGQNRAFGVGEPVGPRAYAPGFDFEPLDGRNALPYTPNPNWPDSGTFVPGRAPGLIQRQFGRGPGKLKPFGQGQQNGTDLANGVWIAADAPPMGGGGHRIEMRQSQAAEDALQPTEEAVYSIFYATTRTGGSISPWVNDNNTNTLDKPLGRRVFDDTRGALGTLFWKLKPATLPVLGYQIHPYFNDTEPLRAQGPVALFWHSVHARRHGFSVSMLSYYGGRTLSDIAFDVASARTGYVDKYVRAIRSRALDAHATAGGKKPGIVFWMEGGINDIVWESPSSPFIEAPDNALFAVRLTSLALFTQAIAAGYEPDEIGFVFQTSHQPFLKDPIANKRETLAAAAAATRDWALVESARVAPYGALKDGGYFDILGPVHLNIPGYDFLMSRALTALVGPYSPPRLAGGESYDCEALLAAVPDAPTPCDCRGDLVRNGVVDASDMMELLLGWGVTTSASREADMNDDGFVNTKDLADLLLNWGYCSE
jgi:hypothetical protein